MDASFPKPQFIRVLLYEFMQKLWIPRKFEQHIRSAVHRKATLHSPLGKPWYVKIEQEDAVGGGGRLYLGEGWKEFAEAHELRPGYTMVFCYEGCAAFTFKVFDLTTCLKVYKYNPTIADLKKSAKKKKKKKKEKGVTMTERKFVTMPFSVEKPHHLERIIRPSHVTYMYLDMHKRFCEMNGLYPGKEVVLRDPEGRSWRVRICRGGIGWFKFGMGWRIFFRRNKLKVGDRCLLDVVPGTGQSVVQIQISRE